MPILRRLASLGLPALLPALLFACGAPPPEPAAPALAATDRDTVAAHFRAVCESLESSDNEYYGRAQLAELESYLAQPIDDPLPRVVVRARLAMELLRWGDNPRAVSLLEQARSIADGASLDRDLRQDVTRRLALAYLRLGEQANCVDRHGPASCILPLRPEGIHRDPSGSRAAARTYLDYLSVEPESPTARWLLNLAVMTTGDHPGGVPPAFRPPRDRFGGVQPDFPRFEERATAAGLIVNRPSGGALMDDFDGDGDLDIVTSTIHPCEPMSFFANDGRGAFVERTADAGLDVQLGGLNMIHADYDNDGDLDILVLRGGWMGSFGRMRNSLLRNDGRGNFEDVTAAAGLAEPAYPTQTAAWADVDDDGRLDLYVGNEADDDGAPYPSQLFVQRPDGRFTDVAAAAGVTNDRFAKAVSFGDYDDDGDQDLYVSNLGPNRLYRNDGNTTFVDVAVETGVTEPAGRSFPAWFFDYDNDGDLDLFVADYGAALDLVAAHLLGYDTRGGHPLLYRNEGGGAFREVSAEVGLTAPSLPMGSSFGDLDSDGFLDFYLGTGTPSYESIAPNLMYRNDGGVRFVDVSYAGGFGHLQKGHGVAFGDVDDDGDQDVFEQMGGAYPGDAYPSVLYANPGNGNGWIRVRLVGRRSNRSGIGARLSFEIDEGGRRRRIESRIVAGGSFGESSLTRHVGMGRAERIVSLSVRWPGPGGIERRYGELPLRATIELYEDRDEVRVISGPRPASSRSDGKAR